MKTLYICLITVLSLAATPSILSQDACSKVDPSIAGPFGQLERDIPSMYLINGLNLSQDQAGKMADLMDKAKSLEEKFDGKLRKFTDRRKGDFEKEAGSIVDMSANRGKISQVKLEKGPRADRLRKTRQEMGAMRQEKIKELGELADKAYEVLTDSQKAVIGNFTPCFIPPADFKNPERVGQAAADTTVIEAALSKLKAAMVAKKTTEGRQKLLDHLVPYAMEKRHIKYSEEAEEDMMAELSGRLDLIIDKIKNMSDADFQLEKCNLATKLLPLPNKNNEPDAIRWKVGYYVLNPGVADILRSRSGQQAKSAPAVAAAEKKPSVEMLDRERAIGAAAVINSLELTKEQAAKILPIVQGALKAESGINEEINSAMKEAMEPYHNLRLKLAEGQTTPQVEHAASKSHGKVKDLRQVKLVQKFNEFEKEMDKLLTATQVDFLASDMKEIKEMLKAKGRDETVDKSMEQARQVISDVRRLSGPAFSRDKDQICRKFIEDFIKAQCIETDAVDIEKEVARLSEVLDRTRKLDEAAYSNKRNDIAAEFCPRRSKERPPSYGDKYVHGEPQQMMNPTTRMIFSEAGLQILQKMAAN